MKYRLYGMKPTVENIAWAAGRCRYRATPGYLLVYTRGRKPKSSIQVKAEQLSREDVLWVQRCNMEIIQEMVEKRPDTQKEIVQFLERLESELEKERARLEVEAVGG